MSGFLFILVPVIERIMKSTTRYRKYYSGSLHQKLYDICHDVNFVSTPTHCFFFITWHIDYIQCRWYCHHNCQIEIVELIYSDDIVKLSENYTKQQQQKLERLVLYTYLDHWLGCIKWSWWGQQYIEIRNTDRAIEKESK